MWREVIKLPLQRVANLCTPLLHSKDFPLALSKCMATVNVNSCLHSGNISINDESLCRGESGIFVSLSDRLQLSCQPQRHLCLNPIISVLLQQKRTTKPSYKPLHHDTSCWPQLHLCRAALESHSQIKGLHLNAEFCDTLYTHTCRHRVHTSVFITICTHTWTKSNKQAKYKDTHCFCVTTALSLVLLLWMHRFSPIHCSPLSLTPKALSWNMHSHSICWDPDRVNTRNRKNCLPSLPITVVKPSSFIL